MSDIGTNEPKGKAWWGNQYFDHKSKKWKSLNSITLRQKIIVIIAGILGLFFLYVSLVPIIFDSRNQKVFSIWWHSVWSLGSFMDYLRAIFLIVAGLIFIRGILGVILSPLKTRTATNYILVGSISGVILFIAFWSGLLNGSAGMLISSAFLGGNASELSDSLFWTKAPPGLNFPFIWHLMSWGWIKICLLGCGIWLVGTLPFTNWWKRLT